MCGIVGVVGCDNAVEFLLKGLKRLEYRGYDSAGVAVVGNGLEVVKEKGKINALENAVNSVNLKANIGIGHTRWATHGVPNKENAHPHCDTKMKFAVTHNGIIENYIELKNMLKQNGVSFYSQTDTEVIPKLIEYFYQGSVIEAIQKTVLQLKGSFSLLILSDYEPDTLFAVKNESPMIIGFNQNENYAASDITALIDETRKIIIMEDAQIATIKKNKVELFNFNLTPIDYTITNIDWDVGTAEKNGYKHFMIKEIFEQPQVIKNVMKNCDSSQKSLSLTELDMSEEFIKSIQNIYIIGCGTAYNAGLVARPIIEKFTAIHTEVDMASEFRYRNPLIAENTLAVFISQSGETADTLAALKMLKEKGVKTIAVTNVVGSSITREADYTVYIHAGTEISVASTKAYTGQILSMILLTAHIAKIRSNENNLELEKLYKDMSNLPNRILEILERDSEIEAIADKLKSKESAFYIGRGLDYAAAIEGVLKLKEISYIHSESFAAGELKHGPIALIEKGTPVIAICTQENLLEKSVSNILEVKARNAMTICVGSKNFQTLDDIADYSFLFDIDNELLAPICVAVVLQLLAYYTASLRGCEIDQPRNLAKSVTVE